MNNNRACVSKFVLKPFGFHVQLYRCSMIFTMDKRNDTYNMSINHNQNSAILFRKFFIHNLILTVKNVQIASHYRCFFDKICQAELA